MQTKPLTRFSGSLDNLLLTDLYGYPFRTRLFRLELLEGEDNPDTCILVIPPEHEIAVGRKIIWEMKSDLLAYSQWERIMSQTNLLPPVRQLLSGGYEVHLGFDCYNPSPDGMSKLIEVCIEGHIFRMLGPAFHLGIRFSLDDDLNNHLRKLQEQMAVNCGSYRSIAVIV